jgi:protein-L-isoaspartate(D-aspartate) O-methyltransferase
MEQIVPEKQIDFAAARTHMVESQLRPNRVNDPRVLAAMKTLPREHFLPETLAAFAYIDEDVPLGPAGLSRGRVLMEPLVLARLVQLAEPRAGERALVVGAGTGYGAAVLAACGPAVTALEEDARLLAIARTVLPALAPAVTLVEGKLAAGWPAGAPWHIVLIEGTVPQIPPAITEQLSRESGRVVTVLAERDSVGRTVGVGRAVVGRPSLGGLAIQSAFDCATSPLPTLVPPPTFTF